jgi:hypothetical protein
MRLSRSYNPRREFNGLTWVDLGLFLIIFFKIDFFSQFYSSISGWLGIEIQYFLQFVFYGVIVIL